MTPKIPSHPPPTVLRDLAQRTHLDLIQIIRRPLYRHQVKPRSFTLMEALRLKPAETFRSLMEAMYEANIEQGVVR